MPGSRVGQATQDAGEDRTDAQAESSNPKPAAGCRDSDTGLLLLAAWRSPNRESTPVNRKIPPCLVADCGAEAQSSPVLDLMLVRGTQTLEAS